MPNISREFEGPQLNRIIPHSFEELKRQIPIRTDLQPWSPDYSLSLPRPLIVAASRLRGLIVGNR